MTTGQEHELRIEVYLPVEGQWVETDRHRQEPNGWVAYQVGERVGIAPPEHWRPRTVRDGSASPA